MTVNLAAENSNVALERFRQYLRILAGLQLPPRVRRQVDPSDLVQQTLLKAHAALSQFRGQSDRELAAWLRKILARTLANSLRDLGRAKRDIALERSLENAFDQSSARLEEWLVAHEFSPSQQAERNEQAMSLVRALSQLPEAQREALVLKHCQCWSLAQIGKHMDRTPTAVASLLQRGLKQLRDHFREVE